MSQIGPPLELPTKDKISLNSVPRYTIFSINGKVRGGTNEKITVEEVFEEIEANNKTLLLSYEDAAKAIGAPADNQALVPYQSNNAIGAPADSQALVIYEEGKGIVAFDTGNGIVTLDSHKKALVSNNISANNTGNANFDSIHNVALGGKGNLQELKVDLNGSLDDNSSFAIQVRNVIDSLTSIVDEGLKALEPTFIILREYGSFWLQMGDKIIGGVFTWMVNPFAVVEAFPMQPPNQLVPAGKQIARNLGVQLIQQPLGNGAVNGRYEVTGKGLEMSKNGPETPLGLPEVHITSKIKDHPGLVTAAENACRDQKLQKEINEMVEKLRNGNLNPGHRNHKIYKDIWECRAKGKARLYIRKRFNPETNVAHVEIIAKSGKDWSQTEVIKLIKKHY
jgi:hypothetical protein